MKLSLRYCQATTRAKSRLDPTPESEGNPSTLSPIDQVVLAVGLKPKDELKAALEALKIPYAMVGDAKSPRRIFEAVEEGVRAAWEL